MPDQATNSFDESDLVCKAALEQDIQQLVEKISAEHLASGTVNV